MGSWGRYLPQKPTELKKWKLLLFDEPGDFILLLRQGYFLLSPIVCYFCLANQETCFSYLKKIPPDSQKIRSLNRISICNLEKTARENWKYIAVTNREYVREPGAPREPKKIQRIKRNDIFFCSAP